MEPLIVIAGIASLMFGWRISSIKSRIQKELCELRDEIDELKDEDARIRATISKLHSYGPLQ